MKQKYQRFSFHQLWPQPQQESPAAQGAAAAAAAVGALLGCQTEVPRFTRATKGKLAT